MSVGSRFVRDTGDVLTEIAGEIIGIATQIDLIAASSQEQSTSLGSVNGSVNELDHMTQQNAAMVEETNAATQQLAEDIATLSSLLSRFRLEGETRPQAAAPPDPHPRFASLRTALHKGAVLPFCGTNIRRGTERSVERFGNITRRR